MTDEQMRCIAAAVTLCYEFLKEGGRIDGQSDIEAAIFTERVENFISLTMPGEILDIGLLDKEED